MGIRSLIYFEEKVGEKIITYIVIYQRLDGDPKCVGLVLAHFLKHTSTTNEFGRLVAQFIAQEKELGENLSIDPQLSSMGDIINWEYHVTFENYNINITVKHITDEKPSNAMLTNEFLQYCCDAGGYDIKRIDYIMWDREKQLEKERERKNN